MRGLILILVVAIAAASPASAATKHKKKMTAQEIETANIEKQNDNTKRLLRDSLPLVLPSWSLPIFFGMKMDEKLKQADKH